MIRNFLQERDFEHGYAKAIIDITNYIEHHSETLKTNKLMNRKGILLLLKAMYENRETFLEVGEDINFILTKEGKIILET